MKGFVCKVCGFIAIDGKAPDNCPVCHAPRSAFEEKEDAVKTAGSSSVGETEKKHIPVIIIERKCGLIPDGCLDVNIKVGEITHPMLPEHFIMHVDSYIDKKFISRTIFTPENVNPATALHLKVKIGRLTVIETCSVHGSWISEIDL